MLKNKCCTTLANDATDSSLKRVKITGIVTSHIPVIHSPIKRCPNDMIITTTQYSRGHFQNPTQSA